MCGIAGIYFKDPSATYLSDKETEKVIDWLLCGIEHRGTHATGMAVQYADGETTLEKSDMTAGKFIFWRDDLKSNPRTILLHTRHATKGKPENILNNHPVQYENIMAIHNGHISNDDELFESEKLARIAEVDSEIIPALLHKYSFNNAKEALEKMSGGYAIAAIDSINPGQLLLAKGQSSPLHYIETKGMFVWASEIKVIREAMLYALNFEVKYNDVHELTYGKYMMIDAEGSAIDDFKPYYKSYTPTSSTTKYPSNSRYTDGWESDRNYGRDQCDECFVWFAFKDLTSMKEKGKTTEYYCHGCLTKLFDYQGNNEYQRKPVKKLSRKERKRLRKQKMSQFRKSEFGETRTVSIPKKAESEKDGVSKALDNEHWAVCQLVAEFFSTKPEFVNFLLFSETEPEDFEDPNLVTMYVEFEEKYREYVDELRGETDLLIEAMSHDTRFPVGFGGACNVDV